MPVTAKLSRKFYEKFGDELTNELVGWFNLLDTTHRGEFRDLFDTRFAQFDAKLAQRIAELRAELQAQLREAAAELRADSSTGLAALEGRLLARIGVLDGRFGTLEGRLVRWMFVFWAASLGTVLAVSAIGG